MFTLTRTRPLKSNTFYSAEFKVVAESTGTEFATDILWTVNFISCVQKHIFELKKVRFHYFDFPIDRLSSELIV
ncbi:MAG TPA: hypothetical protein DD473_28690 [Planctomycetaceae bacterium]|nr:hypothetical protein [Planctomycetaceae bacterium]